MEERGNKTIMCSVMFLDIVAYSKKSVATQIAQKELFNTLLASAIQHVPLNDRVILDTGDGAAITFLGDVEDALKAALSFREGLLGEGAKMEPPLEVCMGINLGPVRLVTDINGRPNIVGDGINVAQRIMGFAKPGQILVSRSYLDAASRLSQEYAGMFRREGMRADKHDRVHEVYSIGRPGEEGADKVGEDTLGLAVKLSPIQSVTGKFQVAVDKFMNAAPQQRALYAGIAATALLLLIVVGVKIMGGKEKAPAPEARDTAMAPAPASEVAPSPLPEVSSQATQAEPEAKTDEKKSTHHKDSKAEKKKKKDSSQSSKSSSRAPDMATVDFAVVPWGEIYLDGQKQGVSPPLDILHVTPGKHNVEIRNTTFPPYTLSIEVKEGEQLKVRHKFK